MDQVFYTSGPCSVGELRAPAWHSPPSRLQIIVPKVDKRPRVPHSHLTRMHSCILEYTGPCGHTHALRALPGGPCPSFVCSLCPGAVSPSTLVNADCWPWAAQWLFSLNPANNAAGRLLVPPLTLRAQRWHPAGGGGVALHLFPCITYVVPQWRQLKSRVSGRWAGDG